MRGLLSSEFASGRASHKPGIGVERAGDSQQHSLGRAGRPSLDGTLPQKMQVRSASISSSNPATCCEGSASQYGPVRATEGPAARPSPHSRHNSPLAERSPQGRQRTARSQQHRLHDDRRSTRHARHASRSRCDIRRRCLWAMSRISRPEQRDRCHNYPDP